MSNNQSQTANLSFDYWLDQCDQGSLPEDWCREDAPLPRPTITVHEAFELGVLPEAKLIVRWSGANDSEDHPPARTVTYIERHGANYLVRAQDLVNTCPPSELLEIGMIDIQSKLLWGAWLQMRRITLDLEGVVEVSKDTGCEFCGGVGCGQCDDEIYEKQEAAARKDRAVKQNGLLWDTPADEF